MTTAEIACAVSLLKHSGYEAEVIAPAIGFKPPIQYIAGLLEGAVLILSRRGCNDWDFPGSVYTFQVKDFCREAREWSGTAEYYDPNDLNISDFLAAGYLAAKLRKAAGI